MFDFVSSARSTKLLQKSGTNKQRFQDITFSHSALNGSHKTDLAVTVPSDFHSCNKISNGTVSRSMESASQNKFINVRSTVVSAAVTSTCQKTTYSFSNPSKQNTNHHTKVVSCSPRVSIGSFFSPKGSGRSANFSFPEKMDQGGKKENKKDGETVTSRKEKNTENENKILETKNNFLFLKHNDLEETEKC